MHPRIAYGLSADLPALAGLTPPEVGQRLRQFGCDGVFAKHLDLEWVESLAAAGLRVYASQGVFIAGDDLWERLPGSRPITAAGEPAPQEEWYRPALPTLPELRQERLDQLEALVAAAPVDGVWLDFIRWPARWERGEPSLYHSSFDPVTLAQFQADTGTELPEGAGSPAQAATWILEHAATTWYTWRCHQITAFVAEARARIHRHRPHALLGLFLLPWTGTDLDRTGIARANVRIAGQDLALLSPYADVISPMVYHRLCGREPGWVGDVTGWAAANTSLPVWPVVESIEPAGSYPAEEFALACRAAVAASAAGLITFQLDGLLDDPGKIEVWRNL